MNITNILYNYFQANFKLQIGLLHASFHVFINSLCIQHNAVKSGGIINARAEHFLLNYAAFWMRKASLSKLSCDELHYLRIQILANPNRDSNILWSHVCVSHYHTRNTCSKAPAASVQPVRTLACDAMGEILYESIYLLNRRSNDVNDTEFI